MSSVIVVDYDPRWPAAFGRLRDRIWPAVRDHALNIEHVGSTSVPGLAAKPIVDMTIVVREPAGMSRVIGRLAALGYRHRGDLGIAGREAFAAPVPAPGSAPGSENEIASVPTPGTGTAAGDGSPAHHLYACVHGSLALRNHLAVRDCLRSDPEAVAAYARVKKKLAAQHPDDIDAYIEGKSPVILRMLERAGFAADELRRIGAMNSR